jgi:hypothetical protein
LTQILLYATALLLKTIACGLAKLNSYDSYYTRVKILVEHKKIYIALSKNFVAYLKEDCAYFFVLETCFDKKTHLG